MQVFHILLLIGWLSVLSACAQRQVLVEREDSATAQERRLLVTFSDQSIDRDLAVNSLDGYRSSEQYANSGWSRRIAADLAERHHLAVITQWPVSELGLSCVVYEAADQADLQRAMAGLQNERQIVSVQAMHSFQALSAEAGAPKSNADPYLALQNGYQSLGISKLHRISTGRGVHIAIIDSGVDIEHPDLQGQIKLSQNLAPEPADHNLAERHGTAVAGVLSAKADNGIGIAGIAPDAEVFALRACWPDQPGALAAHCNSFTLALALNQAMRLQSRIINLSLSGPDDALLRLLLDKALSKGIIVIAAAPANDQTGGFPANMPGVIAVGQGGATNIDQITAPGQDILTTVPQQAYDFMSGSSFATPHVAGLAALALQLHPDWQIADIKRLLAGGINNIAQNLPDSAETLASQEPQR